MANGTVVTRKGLQLITKLVASETALTFTRVAIGTGKVPGGYDPGSMTGLNEYKMDGSIASHSASGDEASVVMQISSIGVETGFTITEAGLFATDPDEGEILYAYLDLSADPQYMYPENNAISKFIEMTLVVKIGEVQSVTAVINPGSLVTKEKFDEIAYPTLPKLDESKNEQDYILDGGEDIRWLLARYEYVKQHYAKSIDLMDEKRTSVHQNDIINGFGEGVTGDLVTVMGTILGQKHDTDINYLKNYGLLKSMITQANVDSLDKIPSAYLLYQLNKDLLDKYENLLTKYNELNSNLISSEMQTTQEASTTSVTLSKRGKTAMVSCVFTTLKDMSAASYDSVTVGYLPDELHPVKDVDIIFGRQGSNDLYYGRIRASGKIELWCWGGKEIPNGTNFSFSSVFLTV